MLATSDLRTPNTHQTHGRSSGLGQETGDNRLELDMTCTHSTLYEWSCSEDDFTMECRINDDEDELDCEGNGLWDGYEFEWERDGE